jgi:cytidine deaminase
VKTPEHLQALLAAATEARLRARPEYSGFHVGAAIEDADGRIYPGCNIESSSYGLTICGERCALFAAIAAGARAFRRVAVVTDSPRLTPPCGACRQVLWDFCGDIEIVLANLEGAIETRRLADLFPDPFDAKNIT